MSQYRCNIPIKKMTLTSVLCLNIIVEHVYLQSGIVKIVRALSKNLIQSLPQENIFTSFGWIAFMVPQSKIKQRKWEKW